MSRAIRSAALLSALLAAAACGPEPVKLASIAVTPADASIARGTSTWFEATGTYSDGSVQDLTKTVQWTVDDASVAAFPAEARAGVIRALAVGSTRVVATLDGVDGAADLTVTDAELVSLSIDPRLVDLPIGTTEALTATGTFTDGTTQDLTDDVTWASSDTSVAQVSEGVVTALGVGGAEITASKGDVEAKAAVAVRAATLERLTASRATLELVAGTSTRLAVTATFSDDTTQDVSSLVTWSSSAPEKISVSNAAEDRGLVRALAAGTGTLTATLNGETATVAVTVTNATLVRLVANPPALVLAKGTTGDLAVTGEFSDGTTQNLTAQLGYSTSDAAIATVSNGTDRGRVTSVAAGTAEITAALGQVSTKIRVTVTAAELASLSIAPTQPSLAKGSTLRLVATGVYGDGTSRNLTSLVTWSVADTAIAEVANSEANGGRVTGLAAGSTTVRAQLGAVQASTSLTVTAATLARLEIAPATVVLARGTTANLTATGVYSDQSTQALTDTVSWTSSNEAVATVSATDPRGVVTAHAAGTADIVATLNGTTVTRTVTVTPAVLTALAAEPASLSLPLGVVGPLRIAGTFSDGTAQDVTSLATYTSVDPDVATVSATGAVTPVAVGSTTVGVAIGGVTTNVSVEVTDAVLAAINVTPALASVGAGQQLQLVATAVYGDDTTDDATARATWTTSDAAIATVTPGGLLSALGAGTVSITATVDGVTGTRTFVVTPAVLEEISITPFVPRVARDTHLQLTATGLFSDGTSLDLTSAVTWASSDDALAVVSNASGSKGLVSALDDGSVTVTATLNGVIGTTEVTLSSATLTGIDFTPTSLSLPKGVAQRVVATGVFSDATTQDISLGASWTSSDTDVVTVVNSGSTRGTVRAVGVGQALVTASFNGVTRDLTVTVTAAELVSISVTPANPSIPKGATRQLTATGIFTDNTNADITAQATWTSSDDETASVSTAAGTKGLVSALLVGNATITASFDGVQGTTAVTVAPAALVSIELTPNAPTRAKGLKVQFQATGTYTDQSNQDVTALATWTSTNTSVVAVSSAAASRGEATAVGTGTATIRATIGGVSATTTMTVTDPELASVRVVPDALSLPKGTQRNLVAKAILTDGTEEDVTDAATWSVDGEAASVSNADGARGRVTAEEIGSATVAATYQGETGSAEVTVTEAVLASLAIGAPSPEVNVGRTLDLEAIGTYTDGTTQTRTANVSWTSSDPTRATVATGGQNPGRVTGVSAGEVTITAAEGNVTFGLQITVTGAVITSIAVTPAAPTLRVGGTQQFTATATLSDASTQDVTTAVTWSSSATDVATISNTDPNRGQATGVAVGTTQITASAGGVSSAPVTVTVADLPDGPCVVINELQAGASNARGGANSEFVELHNRCGSPVDITGWKLVYRSSSGTSDTAVGGAMSGTIPAGGYFLAASDRFEKSNAQVTVDFNWGGTAIAVDGGGMALKDDATIVDSVGWGKATNSFVETKAAPTPVNDKSIARKQNGVDTDDNSADFELRDTPTPGAPN